MALGLLNSLTLDPRPEDTECVQSLWWSLPPQIVSVDSWYEEHPTELWTKLQSLHEGFATHRFLWMSVATAGGTSTNQLGSGMYLDDTMIRGSPLATLSASRAMKLEAEQRSVLKQMLEDADAEVTTITFSPNSTTQNILDQLFAASGRRSHVGNTNISATDPRFLYFETEVSAREIKQAAMGWSTLLYTRELEVLEEAERHDRRRRILLQTHIAQVEAEESSTGNVWSTQELSKQQMQLVEEGLGLYKRYQANKGDETWENFAGWKRAHPALTSHVHERFNSEQVTPLFLPPYSSPRSAANFLILLILVKLKPQSTTISPEILFSSKLF